MQTTISMPGSQRAPARQTVQREASTRSSLGTIRGSTMETMSRVPTRRRTHTSKRESEDKDRWGLHLVHDPNLGHRWAALPEHGLLPLFSNQPGLLLRF